MQNESDLNAMLRTGLLGYDPHRVENAVGPGTPDIEYSGGHIESKVIENWPTRPLTLIRLPHYTPQQRAWHVRRHNAGGRVHVALGVLYTGEVFTFRAAHAAHYLGVTWTRADLYANAEFYVKRWRVQQFQDWIAWEVGSKTRRMFANDDPD